MKISNPVIRKIEDNGEALLAFEDLLSQEESDTTRNILISFPTVYIYSWKDTDDYEVYIGETNNILQRMRQHLESGTLDKNSWQWKALNKTASLYIIGHEHFNKSLTLDIENKLMQYMLSVPKVRKVHNLRGNPQRQYYPVEELKPIFSKIWEGLEKENRELFPAESMIWDSAIFKASPLHKLTDAQVKARELIIERVKHALRNSQDGQLIFVEGEAGTGKTVLNSSTFYEIFCEAEEKNIDIKCSLIVNHEEQAIVYKQIAEKLGLNKYGEVVYRPIRFINTHSPAEPVDVAFVDEAHLLLTMRNRAYHGYNQLQDIMNRAKVTVVMFDENQILTAEQYWEAAALENYRRQAKTDGNYIVLKDQLRIQADRATVNWIDSFTKEKKIVPLPGSCDTYEIRIFNSPEDMEAEIRKKAAANETKLSRLIATYDWDYNADTKKQSALAVKCWEVIINQWHKPWNRELEPDLTGKEKREVKKSAWAEQPHTIDEVGSTYTIQGFDLNYAGASCIIQT